MLSVEFSNIFASSLGTAMFRPDAYLDPGSGSFILQLVVASLVGIGFFFRSVWLKLINKLRKLDSRVEEEDEQEHADDR